MVWNFISLHIVSRARIYGPSDPSNESASFAECSRGGRHEPKQIGWYVRPILVAVLSTFWADHVRWQLNHHFMNLKGLIDSARMRCVVLVQWEIDVVVMSSDVVEDIRDGLTDYGAIEDVQTPTVGAGKWKVRDLFCRKEKKNVTSRLSCQCGITFDVDIHPQPLSYPFCGSNSEPYRFILPLKITRVVHQRFTVCAEEPSTTNPSSPHIFPWKITSEASFTEWTSSSERFVYSRFVIRKPSTVSCWNPSQLCTVEKKTIQNREKNSKNYSMANNFWCVCFSKKKENVLRNAWNASRCRKLQKNRKFNWPRYFAATIRAPRKGGGVTSWLVMGNDIHGRGDI